jgi:hypothetical protein
MSLKLLLPSVLLAFLALGAAACGGGDDSGNPFGLKDDADTGSVDGNGGDADSDDGNDGSFGDSGFGLEENCTFRVDLSGAVDDDIDWDQGCGGLGSEESMELVFTDGTDTEGLVFLVSISGIEEGETGRGFAVTISILGTTDDETAIFHGTEEGDCTAEIASHKELEGSFGVGIYAVKGRIRCTESAAASFGDAKDIDMGDIEFEAPVAWPG